SSSNAASSSQYWSRSCTAAMKCSRRSSIHLTGRRSLRLAADIATSSGYMTNFAPKPTDVGRDNTNLVLVEPQQRHQERPHLVRELGRRPQRQPILVGVINRKRAAAFDRMR